MLRVRIGKHRNVITAGLTNATYRNVYKLKKLRIVFTRLNNKRLLETSNILDRAHNTKFKGLGLHLVKFGVGEKLRIRSKLKWLEKNTSRVNLIRLKRILRQVCYRGAVISHAERNPSSIITSLLGVVPEKVYLNYLSSAQLFKFTNRVPNIFQNAEILNDNFFMERGVSLGNGEFRRLNQYLGIHSKGLKFSDRRGRLQIGGVSSSMGVRDSTILYYNVKTKDSLKILINF